MQEGKVMKDDTQPITPRNEGLAHPQAFDQGLPQARSVRNSVP